jgi:hypothetical protein
MFGSLATKYANKPRQRGFLIISVPFYLVVFVHISLFKRKLVQNGYSKLILYGSGRAVYLEKKT